jgi:hypothetical protein
MMMQNTMRLLLLLLIVLPLVGCRGCSQNDTPSDAAGNSDEETKKKKQRIVADELRALPFSSESVGNSIKPGHWYQTRHKLKANFGDESLTASLSVVDKNSLPISPWENSTPIAFERNIALAKGQEKAVELKLYHPEVAMPKNDDSLTPAPTTSLLAKYSMRGLGTPVLEESFPNKFMAGYQYNLVVLSRDPARYTFWRGLDCIIWPSKIELQQNRIAPHRVVDIQEAELANQFPNQLSTMTSISHVVVNDLSLAGMSQEQTLALADWLRFGGTIIVNGPDAVSGVQTSFLKDLVPLTQTSDGEWTETLESQLNDQWTIRIAGGESVLLAADRKIPILQGTLADGAQWVPLLEGLVAERLVGQGRIVMTLFPMSDAALVRWPSYSSLIHNAILRKPHRNPTLGDEATLRYADAMEGTELNPYHSTRFRLWARDFDMSMIRSDADVNEQGAGTRVARFPGGKSTSIGAWNASSQITENATVSLRESSGIQVPDVGTILRLLIGYLVVLVPVNWLVFRLINRVELAWLAAPFIALIGTFVVAWSVALDVGFSRSQSSIGFLECHNDYPRGVLSNYHALYTSLSTNYQAVYRQGDGLVVPMPRSTNRRVLDDNRPLDYWIADDGGAGLQRLPVLSNTTGLIQSEEVIDLGGSIAWSIDEANRQFQATSGIDIAIRDIGLIGIDEQGNVMTAWVGSPEPGSTVSGKLEASTGAERWRSEWQDQPLLAKPVQIRVADGMKWTDVELDDVYLGAMLHSVAQRYPLQRGEWIALGWTDATVSGLEISPKTAQTRSKTVVLLHAKTGSLPEVRPDVRIFPRQSEEEL